MSAALSSEIAGPGTRSRTPWIGWAGLAWALTYVPIHVYWALGGLTPWLGITSSGADLRMANWGACMIIVGAGLSCLSLTQRWAEVLPRGLRHGVAWVGAVFGIAHWLVYSGLCALRLAGVVAYPSGPAGALEAMHHYDWANLVYFEPWFGLMGVLLIGCSRYEARRRVRTRGADRDSNSARERVTGRPLAGTVVTLAGLFTVLAGVFTFSPWVFALLGPALMGLGLLILATTREQPR